MDKLAGLYHFLTLDAILKVVGLRRTTVSMLRLDEASKLLEHDYLPVETGYGISDDGLAHVATSTYMKGVAPEMIDWWFGWVRTTEQYKLWHPRDHIASDWEGPTGEYIGGAHLAEEYIGGERSKLRIAFKDPSTYFGPDWKEQFQRTGYGTAICARVAVWDDRQKSYNNTGHLIHLIKREPDGCRMRSRFWLGDIDGVPVKMGKMVPNSMTEGLSKHCTEEMSILATFLPALYEKETGHKARL